MPETPLLREPLARAIHACPNMFEGPPPDTDTERMQLENWYANRILAALANDPETVAKVRRLLDRRIRDWGGYAGDNYLDHAAAEDAAALFGEPK